MTVGKLVELLLRVDQMKEVEHVGSEWNMSISSVVETEEHVFLSHQSGQDNAKWGILIDGPPPYRERKVFIKNID